MQDGSDELHLLGMLQIETAQDALQQTGMNSVGLKMLSAFVSQHALTSGPNTDEPHLASFYIQGGDTRIIKEAKVESLGVVTMTSESETRRVAAGALLDLLTGDSIS